MGTLLKPLIFGRPLFELSNLSGIPTVAICVVLASSKSPRVHSVLAPLIVILLVLDTLLAGAAISTG